MFALNFTPFIIFVAAIILTFLICVIALSSKSPVGKGVLICIFVTFVCFNLAVPVRAEWAIRNIATIIAGRVMVLLFSVVACLIGAAVPLLFAALFGSSGKDRSHK